MLILAAILSVGMGLVLGLLGGGGSILTVPILVYALGLEPKEAIATSLLVVGVTSAVGVVQHARAGNVRYKTGLTFGAVAMIGAYAGGHAAAWIPGNALLILFAAMMLATSVSMLRARRDGRSSEENKPHATLALVLEGLVVGAVTGMIGAGGGFLVVPALALLVGLPMRAAVGTSLLIIAMKSFAGLAGHLSHASIDPLLAGVVTAAAVGGSFGGAALVERIEPARLRKLFAALVLTMAAFMLYRELPASWRPDPDATVQS